MKNVSHHISLGKCKFKQDTTTQLLESTKPGTLMTPISGEGVEQQEPSCTVDETAKWHSPLGDSLAVFHKAKHTLTCDLSITLLGFNLKVLKTYVHTKPSYL